MNETKESPPDQPAPSSPLAPPPLETADEAVAVSVEKPSIEAVAAPPESSLASTTELPAVPQAESPKPLSKPSPHDTTKDAAETDNIASAAASPVVSSEKPVALHVEQAPDPSKSESDVKAEPDPRGTLRHVLVDSSPPPPPLPSLHAPSRTTPPPAQAAENRDDQTAHTEPLAQYSSHDSSNTQPKDRPSTPSGLAETPEGGAQPNLAAITYTLRKNANGGFSTVYSGSRIKYLKKDDGLPFWRADIQYAMLKYIFEDKNRVFTRFSDGKTGHTFCEIYVDAMANSSKCSQTLKEKLLFEYDSAEQAMDLAMVCLLVNVGRMNTTVNFFPEMRARVRTFHPIPSLQVNSNPSAYKQLQDGPRLKSILKGAMEDMPQPSSLEQLVIHPKPRTNPVNLIFVLAQYAPRVSDLHFPSGMDFFDLFMRNNLSSKSRAMAFLWMIWWYLESDFSSADSQRNPFGKGQPKRTPELAMSAILSMVGIDTRVPEFETLTEEEAIKENEDPQNELDYGEHKRRERQKILSTDVPRRPYAGVDDQPASYAPSHSTIEDSHATSFAEHQHYRHSPHHSKVPLHYNSSPSQPPESRGRRTPSPHRSRMFGEHLGRPSDGGRERTRSHSPASLSDLRPGSAENSLYLQGKGSPEEESRRGPGRGNYPRRQKLHPIQPFEQMYRPDQFENTSAPSAHQYAHEHSSRTSVPPNGYNQTSHTYGSHQQPPPQFSPPPQSSQSQYYYASSASHGLSPPNSHPAPAPPAATTAADQITATSHSGPPALAPAPSNSPRESAVVPAQPEPTASTQQSLSDSHPNDNHEKQDKRTAKSSQSASAKRSRPGAERARTAEELRNERVMQILHNSADAISKAKRQERKTRGPVIDAWIKARALPEGYDSDDDELNRTGGVDEYRREGGEDLSQPPLSMTFGNENKNVYWNAGDVGQQTGSISKTWRRMARVYGAREIVERARTRLRGGHGDEDNDIDEEVDITSSRGKKERTSLNQASANSPAIVEDDDDSTAAEPQPKKRRRLPLKGQAKERAKPTKGGRAQAADNEKSTSKGAKISLANRGRKRPGASGVPSDQFFGNGSDAGDTKPKGKSRPRTSVGAATRRTNASKARSKAQATKESQDQNKPEVDEPKDTEMKHESGDEGGEVDRELLADVDADESDNENESGNKNDGGDDADAAPEDSFLSAEPAPQEIES